MSTFDEAKHPRNHPTGVSRFGEKLNTAPEAALPSSPAPADGPFVFDGEYRNNEQVRYLFAEYSAVRAELDAAGEYPYDDSFVGRLPSLEGTDKKNTDTAIYLLQTMHSLDALEMQRASFVAAGGTTTDDLPVRQTVRGTVAHFGFYMGGTGWQQWENARLTRTERGRLLLRGKGQQNGIYLAEGKVLVNTGAQP